MQVRCDAAGQQQFRVRTADHAAHPELLLDDDVQVRRN
jgi:hypothetical protein